ncbi:MAG: family 16 glycosylhydrolase [Polyangiaceae bacterium]|nr:family 16 glycosylhydrolase [Polyangiaceae bacterium]
MMLTRPTLPAVLLAVTTLSGVAWADASAELYHNQAYVYGRFEARIRYAAGDGVVSSFFLWKEGSELEGAFWNELDFEKIGADCQVQTNALYGNPESVHKGMYSGSDLCTAYHDYRFDWTPTYIAWAVDGQEIRRDTGETATAFAQNAANGMRIHFNVWPGDASFGGNYNPSILPVYQYISWVQYSSYDNGSFNLEWREDFAGGNLPSGWAAGDWSSPKGRSTHNPNNVGFVDGIAVLSLTTDGATGTPSTVPPDGAGTGGTGTGGTSTGGESTGGGDTGGESTGGTGNGGTSTGGTNLGGETTGGMSTGGFATGGVATGGVAAGGTSTGGTNLGGEATGGVTTGGVPAGGTNVGGGGGTVTGGVSAGGTTTGGVASGGWTSGGGTLGGTNGSGGGTGTATGGDDVPMGTGGATGGDNQGGLGTAATSGAASEEPGCACRVRSGNDRTGWHSVFGLLALLLTWRRRGSVRGRELTERRRPAYRAETDVDEVAAPTAR